MIKIYLPESNVKVTIIIETITPPPSSSPPPSAPSTSKIIQFPDNTDFPEGRAYAQ